MPLQYSEYNKKGPQRCHCGLFMAKTSYGWLCSQEVPVERGWLWEHR
jgi:ferredoxin-thioredoxin reductase catalytic subunit